VEDKKKMIEVKATLKFEEETIRFLLFDAIEVGTPYWAYIWNNTEEFKKLEDKDLAVSEEIWEIISNGGTVEFSDVEEVDEDEKEAKRYPLTMKRLLDGIVQNMNERPHDCDLENYDATTADCILQYALFGEVIFG